MIGACILQLLVAGVIVWILNSTAGPLQAVAVGVAEAEASEPSQTACVPADLAARAGRVLIAGLPGVTEASAPLVSELSRLHIGGVLLNAENVKSAEQVDQLVRGLRAASSGPLLVTADEEPGRVSAFSSVIGNSPSARRLAAEKPLSATRTLASEIGAALAAAGVDLDLAPVLDLDSGPSRGIVGDRSFSADPVKASTYAMAFAAGLDDHGVASAAKHFPGHGQSTSDSHVGRATASASLESLRATDLRPFKDMIDAGVPVVMLNHVDYLAIDPQRPASLSPRAYGLLREMGFRGAAITDSVGMGAVNQRWDVAEAAVLAIAAGADGVLVTDGSMVKHMHRALLDAIANRTLDERRLNEAAARMTALAGGDPRSFACQTPDMPAFRAPRATITTSSTDPFRPRNTG